MLSLPLFIISTVSPILLTKCTDLISGASAAASLAKKTSRMLNNFYCITKRLQKSIFKNIRF